MISVNQSKPVLKTQIWSTFLKWSLNSNSIQIYPAELLYPFHISRSIIGTERTHCTIHDSLEYLNQVS